jgi:hypothetical protein
MARVINFSRQYPKHHSLFGESTFFVEKLFESFYGSSVSDFLKKEDWAFQAQIAPLNPTKDAKSIGKFIESISRNEKEIHPKLHTIREGNNWKVGDYFSPRVWSEKPYRSGQIILAPDQKIVKTWKFEYAYNGYFLNEERLNESELAEIAKNDGLTLQNLKSWFNKPFVGEIICWDENVEY